MEGDASGVKRFNRLLQRGTRAERAGTRRWRDPADHPFCVLRLLVPVIFEHQNNDNAIATNKQCVVQLNFFFLYGFLK